MGIVERLRRADWVRNAAWARWVPVVVIPILLLASTFPEQFTVSAQYWLLSMLAAVVFALGGRAPLPTSLALSVIGGALLSMPAWGMSGLVPYLAAIGLLDLAARGRRARAIAAGTAAWTAAVIVGAVFDYSQSQGPGRFAVVVLAYVGVPLVAGLYLRGRIELADRDRRRIAAELAGAQQAERAALARELHDLVAHHMAAIIMRVGVARTRIRDPQSSAVLDDVHATASQALGNIRALLAAVRGDASGPAEISDVRGEVLRSVERTRAAGFDVSSAIEIDGGALDPIGALTLVRVVQEALTNVMKHARPGSVAGVRIAAGPAAVIAEITSELPSDAARPHGTGRAGGHGLDGMAERARLAGGRLDAGPGNRCWRVRLEIPTLGGEIQ